MTRFPSERATCGAWERERATATGDDIPRLEIYKAGHVNENSPFQTFALPYDSLPQSKGHPISKIGEEKGGIYSASFYTVTCPHPVAELKADHPLPRRRTRCSLWAACLPGRKLKPKGLQACNLNSPNITVYIVWAAEEDRSQ